MLILALLSWIAFQIWGWDLFGLPTLDAWNQFWVGLAGSVLLMAIFRDN